MRTTPMRTTCSARSTASFPEPRSRSATSDAAVSLGRMAVDLRAKAVQAGKEKAPNYGFYL